MEQLKKLLSEQGYGDEDISKITDCVVNSHYVPANYIPKSRLDEEIAKKKNFEQQLEATNNSLNDLKKSLGDNEELKKQIDDLKKENKRIADEGDAKIKDFYETTAIKEELSKDFYDTDYMLTKVNRAMLTHDPNTHKVLAGLKEQIESFKNDEMLRRQVKETNPVGAGFKPQVGQQTAPQQKEEVSQAVARMQEYFKK